MYTTIRWWRHQLAIQLNRWQVPINPSPGTFDGGEWHARDVSALAKQAGVAKSTVSLIERGRGNPSIDTVWALASALGVPFASLFHDERPDDEVVVVREDDGSIIMVDQAGLPAEGLVVRHMLTRTGGSLMEIHTLALEHGAVRHADAHVAGLFEHMTVAAGGASRSRLTLSPRSSTRGT